VDDVGCAAGIMSEEDVEGCGTSVMTAAAGRSVDDVEGCAAGIVSEEDVEGCGASVVSSAATLTSEDGVDDLESSVGGPVGGLDGPCVAEVGPKYFNNAPKNVQIV